MLFIFCSTSIFSQEIGTPLIRNYSPKEYDNTPQIWGAIKDDEGVMFFGATNGGGIIEYDGKEWRTIDIPNKTTVFSFAKSTDGVIFTGAINDFGFLKKNAMGKTEFSSLRYLIKEKEIKFRAIWQTAIMGNNVYFLSVDGIFIYHRGSDSLITTFLPEEGTNFIGLISHEGKVYTHQKDRGLMRIDPDSIRLVSDFFKSKVFRSGLSYGRDSIMIFTRTDGIYLYRPSDGQVTPFALTDRGIPQRMNIYSAALLSDRHVSISVLSKGLIQISPKGTIVQQWDVNNGMPTNTVYTMYPADNNLWMMSENGIMRTDLTNAWSYWDKHSGLLGTVSDILRHKKRLYVSTFEGIYVLDDQKRMKSVTGIPEGQSWSLLNYVTSSNDTVLLAGTPGGIYQIRGTTATMIRKGSYGLTMFSSAINSHRVFVVDDPTLVSMRYEHGKWIDEGVIRGVKDNIRRIMEDANGDLWLGTYNAGVIRVRMDRRNITEPKEIRYYTKDDGLPTLTTVLPYMLKNEIVFATDHGLYRYHEKNDSFALYSAIHPMLHNGTQSIGRITETEDGSIVVIPWSNKVHNPGILTKGTYGEYEWIDKPFRWFERMEFNTVLTEPSGVVWFGTTEGLYRYDRQLDSKNYDAGFNTLIRKVTVKGDSILRYDSHDSTIVLPYDLNDIKFEAAAPHFDNERKTLFSSQLVGYNSGWSTWSTDAYSIYTNLDEGKYTYRVKAKNLYDTESRIAEFTFTVLPPWYRTWWAFAAYLLFFGIAIITFDTWNKKRLKRLHDRQFEEEKQRQHQFSQLLLERQEDERKRIAREMHDGIGQELLVLKHQLQLKLRDPDLDNGIRELLEEQSAAASNIMTEVRTISHDLRPPELDRLGVTETIKALLNRVRNAKKIAVIGEIESVDGFFAKELEINIIRIIQELINNILKHAEASTVTVKLLLESNGMVMTIADDGKGIDHSAKKTSGLGMSDINERVQLLGGNYTVDSSRNHGTTFTFRFPRRSSDV